MSVLPEGGGGIQRFLAGGAFEYIVDANLRACYFAYVAGEGAAIAEIDCQQLRAAVPKTAEAITWSTGPGVPGAPR